MLDDGQTGAAAAFTALRRQVHLRVAVATTRQSKPEVSRCRRLCGGAVRGGRIVEHRHAPRRPALLMRVHTTPRSVHDDRFTQTADVRHLRVPAAAASCATSPNGS